MILSGTERFKDRIKEIPELPGVYIFRNKKSEIIYIGKAKKLRRRVASYFQKGRAHDARKEMLVNEVSSIEFIQTSTEAEALIYEAGLIKDHAPKYNIDLKDDKSYPFLKLTTAEEYPRIYITRKRLKDGAIYYGPYTNVGLLKQALVFMKKIFPLRTCRRLKKKVCLEYHIDQCYGPCEGRISKKEYSRIVGHIRSFLEGKKDKLVSDLKREMNEFAGDKEYEKALSAKNKIEALLSVRAMHDVSKRPIFGELAELQDVLGMVYPPETVECFDISNIRGKYAVGSMVRFTGGKPEKSAYRKFKIKNVNGIDDYSMIKEVVERRYERLLNENKKMPDLVLIDGGQGHLKAAIQILKKIGINDVHVASIAKEFNHLYISSKKGPIRLSPGSKALFLIQRIRDEAHRFAIEYHRKLRAKGYFKTTLSDINGIGALSEKKLMGHFKNIEAIKKANIAKLVKAGITKRQAEAVREYFR